MTLAEFVRVRNEIHDKLVRILNRVHGRDLDAVDIIDVSSPQDGGFYVTFHQEDEDGDLVLSSVYLREDWYALAHDPEALTASVAAWAEQNRKAWSTP